MREYEVKLSCDIDPIVSRNSHKGRYNRDSYKKLIRHGTLFKIIDCDHWLFDVELRTLEEGDIIQSYNDSIVYVILNAIKNERGQTRWITFQPLFCEHNFRHGLLTCMFLDGHDNPFVKTI